MSEETKVPAIREESGKPERDPKTGRMLPGNDGNGGGRRRMDQETRDILAAATPKAAKVLADALEAERAIVVPCGRDRSQIEYVPDYDVRIKAAQIIHDRWLGKATQAIVTEDGEGNAVPLGIFILPPEKT